MTITIKGTIMITRTGNDVNDNDNEKPLSNSPEGKGMDENEK